MGEVVKALDALVDVQVPVDPSEGGFGEVNEALAKLNRNNIKVTQTAMAAIESCGEKRKAFKVAKTKYELKLSDILATNEEVKAGKNQGERMAVAEKLLAKIKVECTKAENEHRDAEADVSICEHALSSLKTTKEIIAHMLRVSQQEIDIGTRSG